MLYQRVRATQQCDDGHTFFRIVFFRFARVSSASSCFLPVRLPRSETGVPLPLTLPWGSLIRSRILVRVPVDAQFAAVRSRARPVMPRRALVPQMALRDTSVAVHTGVSLCRMLLFVVLPHLTEAEMARTQKNKATEGHLGLLKAKLAKLRSQVRRRRSSTCLFSHCLAEYDSRVSYLTVLLCVVVVLDVGMRDSPTVAGASEVCEQQQGRRIRRCQGGRRKSGAHRFPLRWKKFSALVSASLPLSVQTQH